MKHCPTSNANAACPDSLWCITYAHLKSAHHSYSWSTNVEQRSQQRQAAFARGNVHCCLPIAVGMAHQLVNCSSSGSQEPDSDAVAVCHGSCHEGRPPVPIQLAILHRTSTQTHHQHLSWVDELAILHRTSTQTHHQHLSWVDELAISHRTSTQTHHQQLSWVDASCVYSERREAALAMACVSVVLWL